MIEEAYVSFETAKLLKENGFNGYCWSWYHNGNHTYTGTSRFCNNELQKYEYSKPTQQMAMHWLRKKHNICITIYPDKEKGYEAVLYNIKDDVEIILQSFGIYGYHTFEDSYEQACETAIKYCLENLI